MSHILVVEDDTDIAALIAHYLEKAGHRVERVISGAYGRSPPSPNGMPAETGRVRHATTAPTRSEP